MNILLLASTVPFPPVGGNKIPLYQLIRGLHELGHRIVLLGIDDDGSRRKAEAMNEFCASVRFYSVAPRLTLFSAIRQLGKGPRWLNRYYHPELWRDFRTIVASERFDVIHYDCHYMVQYSRGLSTSAVQVVASRDAFSLLSRRRRELAHTPLEWLRCESQRRRYLAIEKHVYSHTDAVILVSEVDKNYLDAIVGTRVFVVPPGVDTGELSSDRSAKQQHRLLFVGHFGSPANVDAMIWFVRDVFPNLLREHHGIELHIVGPGAEEVPLPAAYSAGIVRRGYVEDLITEYRSAGIFVSPLRYGAGVKHKILEAFSTGIPVVATSISMDGMMASPGVHYLKADSAAEFCDQVKRLFDDSGLRSALTLEARRLVESKFGVPQMVAGYENIYRTLVEEKQAEGTDGAR